MAKKREVTKLMEAVKDSKERVLEVLNSIKTESLPYEINVQDKYGETAIFKAVSAGKYEIASILFEKGANPLIRTDNKISIVDRLEYRIGQGQETNEAKVLLSKFQEKKSEVAKELLEKGATRIGFVAFKGDLDAVNKLIENDKIKQNEVKSKGETFNKFDAVVNQKDNFATPALISAVKSGNIEVVKTLVENGAILGLKDKKGQTALDIAPEGEIKDYLQSKTDEFKKFAEEKRTETSDKNAATKEENKKTANNSELHNASYYNDLDKVKAIVNGATNKFEILEEKNDFGQTPLLSACKAGNIDIVSFLIEEGANPFETDKKGKDTASYLSELSGNVGAETILAKLQEVGNSSDFPYDEI